MLAASLVLGITSAHGADKAFKRDSLGDSAIKLEAQIKTESGAISKTVQQLKTDLDSAFRRNEFRSGMQLLGQVVTVAPNDAGNWLRLSRTILQIRPSDSREKAFLLDRAATSAYIAHPPSS